LADIATKLGVAKSSVSLWVRNVEFVPSKRRTGAQRRPHPFHEAKLKEIAELDLAGRSRIGVLDEAAFLAAGVAPAREPNGREPLRSPTLILASSASSVAGSGDSLTSRSAGCASGCISTKGSIWTPRSRIGLQLPRSL
jgi:hypothetical protein